MKAVILAGGLGTRISEEASNGLFQTATHKARGYRPTMTSLDGIVQETKAMLKNE